MSLDLFGKVVLTGTNLTNTSNVKLWLLATASDNAHNLPLHEYKCCRIVWNALCHRWACSQLPIAGSSLYMISDTVDLLIFARVPNLLVPRRFVVYTLMIRYQWFVTHRGAPSWLCDL
jgi:hypothetical protein